MPRYDQHQKMAAARRKVERRRLIVGCKYLWGETHGSLRKKASDLKWLEAQLEIGQGKHERTQLEHGARAAGC